MNPVWELLRFIYAYYTFYTGGGQGRREPELSNFFTTNMVHIRKYEP